MASLLPRFLIHNFQHALFMPPIRLLSVEIKGSIFNFIKSSHPSPSSPPPPAAPPPAPPLPLSATSSCTPTSTLFCLPFLFVISYLLLTFSIFRHLIPASICLEKHFMFSFHMLKVSQQKDPLESYTLPGGNLMFKDQQ